MGAALLVALVTVTAVACDGGEGGDKQTSTPAVEATETVEAIAGTPSGAATVIVSQHAELGSILTDADGRTLYTFSEDPPNVSTCQNAPCPQTWPPLTIESGTPVAGDGVPGELGVIERPDGSLHVVYDGHPLHYFANDAQPGEAHGQGVGGRWFAVQITD